MLLAPETQLLLVRGFMIACRQPMFPMRLRSFMIPAAWQEDAMFQMINEEKPTAQDRMMLIYKVGVFVASLGAVGAFIYFLTASQYLRG